MNTHEDLLNSAIVPWAIASENVTGLAELGSRVQDDQVDEWADMDLMVLARDVGVILDNDEWIGEIAHHWLALKHPGPFEGLPVRQVLFEGALDFDIVPITSGSLQAHLTHPAFRSLIGAGMRVLVDEEAELGLLPHLPAAEPLSPKEIHQGDFDFAVRDFLFQVVWTTKHLKRGELWAAKDAVDCYMRTHLAEMLEWHAVAESPGVQTRGGGRHLEDWASDRFISRLPETFATYEIPGVATALVEATEFFGTVAKETAGMLGFAYPIESHENIAGWMHTTLGPILE